MEKRTNILTVIEAVDSVILKQTGTRMAEDGEDWNGLEITILISLDDVARACSWSIIKNARKVSD